MLDVMVRQRPDQGIHSDRQADSVPSRIQAYGCLCNPENAIEPALTLLFCLLDECSEPC